MSRRSSPLVAALAGLAGLAGCKADHSRITPTTTGTALRDMPRGRMTPLPFPGSSLARARPGGTKLDPAAMATSGRASDHAQ